ncbi:MAG: peptidoglycan DD-metalloendopeptidase family protein [Proteobacteria bacterium]|nr:peptidoglycan DD-metalloendopeptidase family protein [Pseudomonadota bacterium]
MTLRAGWARLRRRERELRERWFPERQLILREGERARALRLRPGFQIACATALALGVLWSAGATVTTAVTWGSAALADAEADRLRAAYGQLIDEVSQQHSKVLDITQDLEHYRSYLLTLLEQNQTLRRDLRSFANQLDGADGETQRTAAAEQALRGQLQDLGRDLVGVSHRNELLQSDVSQLRHTLEGEDERARFAAARAALDRRMTRLEQDANGALGRTQELERALTAKQQLVEQAQSARRQAVQDRDQLTAKLTDAEQRIQAMAQAHEQALARLSEQTRNTIGEVERIVGAVGLDTKRLVPQRAGKQSRGGPFVPWNARRVEPEGHSEETSEALSTDIARLDGLRQLLRVLPLAAPLKENFSITSTFGYRVDPFNNLGAFHEGVDMQAPLRTRVLAPAPGKVVFAGWHASYGRTVEIDHGYGVKTRYAHLDRIAVHEGAGMAVGQEIGLLGASGRTSGTHLHYEVLVDGRPRNPLSFLRATADVRKNR